jgi:3-oxoacyl-[acyl-carrier-protein] synthase III
MNDNDVYLVDIATILPPRYRPEDVLRRLYGQPGIPGDVLSLATKASRGTGIRSFSSVLDLDAYPAKRLISEQHTPRRWCSTLIDALSIMMPHDAIGYFGISYNTSSHRDVLPNLACQVASERRFALSAPPQELPYHGCASGVMQMTAAVEFCRRTDKAALVIVLEQCTWGYDPITARDDADFRASLRAHLLFADGAAALLIVPASMRDAFPTALRILDCETGFRLGNAITMHNGHFLVGDDVRHTMPRLVASQCVCPLLSRNALLAADVDDWAIHQGGLPVLRSFGEPDILGLTDAQLADSAATFEEFGNLSSASSLFTLRRQFERTARPGTLGMVVAFGAGYYFGAILYERITAPDAAPPRPGSDRRESCRNPVRCTP